MFKHSLRWRTIMMYVLIFTLVLPNVLLPKAHASTNGNVNILSAVNNNVDRNLVNVVYANGKYTAVGEKGRIVQSTDGLNWAVVNTGVSNEKHHGEASCMQTMYMSQSGWNLLLIKQD